MRKITKKASVVLSLMTAVSALGACGKEETKWEYSKEDMSQFIDIEGQILNREDKEYNDFFIDSNFDYFKDTISTADLKVFNYTKLVEEILSGKADFLSFDLIKKYEVPVSEIVDFNEGEDIKITFKGNDDDLYGVLIWETGSTLKTPIISLSTESATVHESNTAQTEFEEKYIYSDNPSWDKAKVAVNIISNLAQLYKSQTFNIFVTKWNKNVIAF